MADKITVFEAQKWAFLLADQNNLEHSAIDLLLCGQMGWNLTQLLTHYQDEFDQKSWELFQANVAKYLKGMPPQYILGYAAFFGRKFKVNEYTLIPRVETQDLVEWILQDGVCGRVLDLGTGSGAIGVTLKKENPKCEVLLSDISAPALAVAKENAQALEADVSFCVSDVFNGIAGKFDVVVSNPPYIALDEAEYMDQSVLDYEPELALFAEDEGLAIYKKICREIKGHLNPNARLYLEIGFLQGQKLVSLFKKAYPKAQVTLKQDESGRDRMVRVIFN